jgi:AGCS family alanine or glycine:cation symporter
MRKKVFLFSLWLALAVVGLAPPAAAQPPLETLDQRINGVVAPVSDAVAAFIFYSVPVAGANVRLIVVWLILAAVIFTLYLKFINFWGFRHALEVVRGKYSDPTKPGEVSHFQALTAALSGTVGLGNIAGVAVAIGVGGPGATLWMIIAAFFGMASKFVECSLGLKYRVVHEDGTTSGGPMYYLTKGLAERGLPGLGGCFAVFSKGLTERGLPGLGRFFAVFSKWLTEHGLQGLGRFLAVFFAIMCVGGAIGAGNMFQANQAYQQLVNATGGAESFLADKGWLFGLVLAVTVGAVIIGGIKSIARVTEKVVPFMGGMYLAAAATVIAVNVEHIPEALASIVTGAFTPEAGFGGMLGVLITGFQRATFSNEAGIGSAPIAYSSVRTEEPLSVGFVSLLEPVIDTVIICTMTALVIVISGVYLDSGRMDGVLMTSAAFETVIDWFPYVLAVAVVLFAFSTIITWSYYSLKCWTYLFGETPAADHSFKLIYCLFTVVGSAMTLDKIIHFSDAMIFAMALPNAIGMYLLAGGLKRDLRSYWSRLQSGELAPRG